MIITEKSEVLPFVQSGIEKSDLNSLYIPSEFSDIIPQLTKIGETIYYSKPSSVQYMTNELIGSYLAKRLGLDTVDYQIGLRKEDSQFFALSELFYEDGYQYQSALEFLGEHHYRNCFSMAQSGIKTVVPCYYSLRTLRPYKGTPFYDKNLKLIALDLKMAQRDRHEKNIIIKMASKGTIDLAPIYDYGRSYSPFYDNDAYGNPFAFIRFNTATLELLFRRYPNLRDYVEFLTKISIDEILTAIEQEKRVCYTEEIRQDYRKAQELSENVINKIKIKTYY